MRRDESFYLLVEGPREDAVREARNFGLFPEVESVVGDSQLVLKVPPWSYDAVLRWWLKGGRFRKTIGRPI